jgi:carbon monoxide dehydrogenase subunit G
MNKFLKLILISPILLAALVFIVGYLLPSQWHVSRSIVINKPPQTIYPLVADFKHGWPQWSDFDYEDPGIQYSYAGPNLGVGASRSWVSAKMGNGFQRITNADPATGIYFDLKMENTNFGLSGKITFEPAGTATKVTWTDSGDTGNNIFFRYMASMMDQMMGDTFDRSLAKLKEKAESKTSQ